MKITSSRMICVGDEPTPIELFESLTAPVSGLGPNFVRVRSSMGPTAAKTWGAVDDDMIAVSNIAGDSAVHVKLTKVSNPWSTPAERMVEPGATVFIEGNAEILQTIDCWSKGSMSVIVIATGRKMSPRQELETRTRAHMQAVQDRQEFLAKEHAAELKRQAKVAEEDEQRMAQGVRERMADPNSPYHSSHWRKQ